jgi:hypothetical protein
LDVSGLAALEYLRCSGNQLEALNLTGLDALQSLECYNNQLEELDVSGLSALEYLDCAYNRLEALDVSGLTALYDLFCDHNRLTGLQLDSGVSYGHIDVSYNHMADTSAVTGQTIGWDSYDYSFAPQYGVVTVNNGTANPPAAVLGETVTITAGAAPQGGRFKEWTVQSGGVTLTDAYAAETTFTMPNGAVEVTAVYETPPAITTSSLPGGTVGTAYSQTLAATGDTPITWSVAGGTCRMT